MKKFLGIIAIMMAFSFAFAKDNTSDEEGASMDTSVQVIVPEDMHTTNKTAQVRIEYIAIQGRRGPRDNPRLPQRLPVGTQLLRLQVHEAGPPFLQEKRARTQAGHLRLPSQIPALNKIN